MTEIDEIRRKYDTGVLDSLKEDLDRFLRTHREQILTLQREQVARGMKEMTCEVAVKFYILRQRTINPQRDIRDQLREIEREKWIQGVNSGRAPDPQEVALEWSRRHSANWRSHRVTSILYVFERDKERYLKLLS